MDDFERSILHDKNLDSKEIQIILTAIDWKKTYGGITIDILAREVDLSELTLERRLRKLKKKGWQIIDGFDSISKDYGMVFRSKRRRGSFLSQSRDGRKWGSRYETYSETLEVFEGEETDWFGYLETAIPATAEVKNSAKDERESLTKEIQQGVGPKLVETTDVGRTDDQSWSKLPKLVAKTTNVGRTDDQSWSDEKNSPIYTIKYINTNSLLTNSINYTSIHTGVFDFEISVRSDEIEGREEEDVSSVQGPKGELRDKLETIVKAPSKQKRFKAKVKPKPSVDRKGCQAVWDTFRETWKEKGWKDTPFRWNLKERKFVSEMLKDQGEEAVSRTFRWVILNWEDICRRYRANGFPTVSVIYGFRKSWFPESVNGNVGSRSWGAEYDPVSSENIPSGSWGDLYDNEQSSTG